VADIAAAAMSRRAAAMGAEVVGNDELAGRSLPDALQPIMLELNVGEATPPFGDVEQGVRVLMLCGRDDRAGRGARLRRADEQIENERINKRAQRYLRDLRRDAVIDYN
jgi:peptidyl-prolyl cis-trans isomerase SurA